MDLDYIENLIKSLESSSARELRVTSDGATVKIRRPSAAGFQADEFEDAELDTADTSEAAESPELPAGPMIHRISSGRVGIFRLNPAVKVGEAIQSGQVIGQIESMKLLNDVVADKAGIVDEIFSEDASPVEYGQPLISLRDK